MIVTRRIPWPLHADELFRIQFSRIAKTVCKVQATWVDDHTIEATGELSAVNNLEALIKAAALTRPAPVEE